MTARLCPTCQRPLEVDELERCAICETFTRMLNTHARRNGAGRFITNTQPKQDKIMNDTTLYDVFHRTWWKHNPAWPNQKEPGVGERHYIAHGVSWTEAREICEDWNATHDPGPLSDKAEFEEE